ncbi:MAG: methyltransferase domain-containing protein [Pseudomonadota bacterium]
MTTEKINFRQYTGKKLLSLLRGGDYAHAGEEEAIDLCMRRFPKHTACELLDVGCGLGKTADYIQSHGYGEVTGVDIEKESIAYAQSHYAPKFLTMDVADIKEKIEQKFDIITLFNSLYAFSNQEKALTDIYSITKTGGSIMIFEYTNLCEGKNPFYQQEDKSKGILPFYPLNLTPIKKSMENIGWQSIEIIDVSDKYQVWYINLLKKLLTAHQQVIAQFDTAYFTSAYLLYSKMLSEILRGTLGGAIIYASK